MKGRFAPSPTGPLHLGSLIAALGSYLQARLVGGEWHVRIDDLDPQRTVPGAADSILRTLECHGLTWDGPVVHQSRRGEAYAAALEGLHAAGATFPCGCTRKQIAAVAEPGPAGPIYPGTCRDGLPAGRIPRSLRVRIDHDVILFRDDALGWVFARLRELTGDYIVRRADGVYAYHLACVVDDAAAGFTHVTRGRDLLLCTPPQIHLQRLLELPSPRYHHLPLAVNAAGKKLSKQTHAPPLDDARPGPALVEALRVLGAAPPPTLAQNPPDTVLAWALDWARAYATFRNTQGTGDGECP